MKSISILFFPTPRTPDTLDFLQHATKTISFQQSYYPLPDEPIDKEITAEVSIRKSTDKSFMTHSVDLVREIKEETVGGEKIRTGSYANKNQNMKEN
mgnify:FL=1